MERDSVGDDDNRGYPAVPRRGAIEPMYRAWQLAARLLRALPLRASYGVATLAGAATFAVWPLGRRAASANFAVVLPGAPADAIRRVARRSIENYCRYLVDFARLSAPHPSLPRIVTGLEHIDELKRRLRAGRGAILTLTHSGNWDAGAVEAARAGLEIAVVAEAVGGVRLDSEVRRAREAQGVRVLRHGRDTLAMLRTLKAGGVVAILVDRPEHAGGVPITFFGRQTRVPGGAARLALSSGAEVVAVACLRTGQGGRDLALRAQFDIAIPEGMGREDAVRELTQAIFATHERLIRAQPSQWYMFRRFWPEEPVR